MHGCQGLRPWLTCARNSPKFFSVIVARHRRRCLRHGPKITTKCSPYSVIKPTDPNVWQLRGGGYALQRRGWTLCKQIRHCNMRPAKEKPDQTHRLDPTKPDQFTRWTAKAGGDCERHTCLTPRVATNILSDLQLVCRDGMCEQERWNHLPTLEPKARNPIWWTKCKR